jgi:transposase
MARRKRRKFTPEFKAEAVRLARVGDRSIQQIATDLDLTESALRNWAHQTEIGAGQVLNAPDALTSAEKVELSELRREVKKLRQESDILKAAATVCHEQAWRKPSVRNYIKDEGGPLGIRLQGRISNRLELRRSKAVVVNVDGKVAA